MSACFRILMMTLAVAAATVHTASATPPVATPLVIGETFALQSKIMHEVRRINVYLPVPYAHSPKTRLPVLYMPDGGLGEDFLHVAGLVQVSVGNGTMRPFILVGIENTERRRDLTGPTEVADDRKIAPRVGGSARFRSFLKDELIPEIERRYRTTSERAIVGESLAGLFVVETLLLEPELFNTYIAFDPSLWWNAHKLLDETSQRLHASPGLDRSLYVAGSSEPGMVELTHQLAEVLRDHAPSGLHWRVEQMPAEKHSTIFHPAAIAAFRTLFAPAR